MERDLQRAKDADELLQNALLQAAFADLEREIVEKLAICPRRDKEGQQELTSLLQLNRRLKTILLGYIDAGKIAAVRLSALERVKQRFR